VRTILIATQKTTGTAGGFLLEEKRMNEAWPGRCPFRKIEASAATQSIF
jgi:hypothetical protein